MREVVGALKDGGFTHSAFGDIFLEDLCRYREEHLAKLDIKTVFPILKQDTKALINSFLDLGFKSIVVCAHSKYFGADLSVL